MAINRSVDEGSPADTLSLMQRPEAMLPFVYDRSAHLYHNGLKMAKIDKQQVIFPWLNELCYPFRNKDYLQVFLP